MSASALRPTADAAHADWARRVAANREQAERLREEAPGDDFYAPVAPAFRADPARRDDPTLNALLGLARPGDTWLDVGAGGGRFSLAIARAVRRVIAVEPSASMRAVFAQTIAGFRDDAGGRIENTELRAERWPPASPDAYAADVAFISHVGYDIEAIGPFLDALEAAASRLCAAVLMDRPPPSSCSALWPVVHGEPQADLPGLMEFLSPAAGPRRPARDARRDDRGLALRLARRGRGGRAAAALAVAGRRQGGASARRAGGHAAARRGRPAAPAAQPRGPRDVDAARRRRERLARPVHRSQEHAAIALVLPHAPLPTGRP